MSAGRSFRRQAGQMTWRRPGVELSADVRAWVGRMKQAHDDPDVSVEEFFALGREWAEFMSGRPEAERVEAGLHLQEHVARDLLGCQDVRVTGMGWLPGAAAQ